MLKSNGKFCKILSAGFLAGILMMGTAINTFAEVQSIVIYDSSSDVNYEYDMNELLKSRQQYKRTGEGALFEDFNELFMGDGNEIVSYYDDKNEYIDYESVLNAYKRAKRYNKNFDFNTFAESDEVDKIAIETQLKKEENGQVVVENNNKEDFRVIGIE